MHKLKRVTLGGFRLGSCGIAGKLNETDKTVLFQVPVDVVES